MKLKKLNRSAVSAVLMIAFGVIVLLIALLLYNKIIMTILARR